MADSFIEKAIDLNPNRFSNHDVQLSLTESRLFSSIEKNEGFQREMDNFLIEIEKVEKKFQEFGNLRERCKATLLLRKLNVYRTKEDLRNYETLVRGIFELVLKCYFDHHIEKIIVGMLWGIYLPKEDLNNLISHLNKTEVEFV